MRSGPRQRGDACLTSASATATVDADFASAASGEWEGHRVYFDAGGTKQPIPDQYVPPAFKEWGVELVDWQSQCAMSVSVERGVYARELRFLPTQGCEADASTVESSYERNLAVDAVVPAPSDAPVEAGSYSAETSVGDGDERAVVVEHCLGFTFPGASGEDEDKRCRVRVQQTMAPGSRTTVATISAWKEYYYEEFKNAASLCASCGGPNKWGESPNTDPADLTSEGWTGDDWAGLPSEGAVMLPQGLWCSAASDDVTGGFVLEAGWLIPDRDAVWLPAVRDVETHLISRRVYDADGALSDVQFLRRTRKP